MINPIIRKESKTALRSWKSFLLISIYTVFMWGVLAVTLNLMGNATYLSGYDPRQISMVYLFMSACQIGLIALIVSGVTGGSISGERERQTLDLLMVTKLSPIRIVLGKLFSAMMLGLLVIFASLPVFGVAFYFGTISLWSLFIFCVYTILFALMCGSAGLLFSALLRRTAVSIILTFAFILLISFGTLIASAVFSAFYYRYSAFDSETMLMLMNILNPILGFMSLVDSFVSSMGMGFTLTSLNIPFWVLNTLAYAILSVLFIILSAVRLSSVKNQGMLWK